MIVTIIVPYARRRPAGPPPQVPGMPQILGMPGVPQYPSVQGGFMEPPGPPAGFQPSAFPPQQAFAGQAAPSIDQERDMALSQLNAALEDGYGVLSAQLAIDPNQDYMVRQIFTLWKPQGVTP